MDQKTDLDRKFQGMSDKIADLQSCLAGNPLSKRWREIHVEITNLTTTLRVLQEKRENNIPYTTRHQNDQMAEIWRNNDKDQG